MTLKQAQVFCIRPENFNPIVEVAACYFEHEGKILLLLRAPHKLEGNKWGVPAGKVENGESPFQAVMREVNEEIGIQLNMNEVKSIDRLYIRKPNIDYVYHMFHYEVNVPPVISLNDEHIDYRWMSEADLQEFPLMSAAIETIDYFKKFL